MKKTLLLAIFTLLVSSGISHAQSVQRITLQDAIRISLENNYQLKQAENNLALAESGIKSEYADFLPSLNGSLRGSRNTGNQFNNNTGEFINNTIYGFNAGISTGITVFGGFENINSLRAAQQDKLSSEESLNRAKENVIFNTSSRYLQVLLNVELLEIAQGNLETSLKQLEQINAQVEVGSRPVVDLYNQESQVANDELQVTNQENALSISKLSLVRQLQIDPLQEYDFITPIVNLEGLTPKDFSLQNLVDEALTYRSDLKSEEANVKVLHYQQTISKAAILPNVSLSAGLSSDANDATIDPATLQGAKFGDQFFDRNVGTGVTMTISIPIFNNLDRSLNIQRAKVQSKNAELAIENTELQIIQEVTQAYIDYVSINKQLEASEKAFIASQKAFETQQERYNVGASTLIELSQAQDTFTSAQSDRTQALYNLIFQEKLLDYYLGKLTGDSIEF